jgi:putative endonuclease
MSYHVYVLEITKNGWLYVGQTSNLQKRLLQHNQGVVKSTRGKGPFRIVYTEEYKTRSEAVIRERFFKSPQGGSIKRNLVNQYRGVAQSG